MQFCLLIQLALEVCEHEKADHKKYILNLSKGTQVILETDACRDHRICSWNCSLWRETQPMFNSTKSKVWCLRPRKSFQSEKNFQGEPGGEIFMSRFGCKIWLMPFVFITAAMGYLTTRGSHDLRLISAPGSSSAMQCMRLPEPFSSCNEVCHSRIDIACSCPASESS